MFLKIFGVLKRGFFLHSHSVSRLVSQHLVSVYWQRLMGELLGELLGELPATSSNYRLVTTNDYRLMTSRESLPEERSCREFAIIKLFRALHNKRTV